MSNKSMSEVFEEVPKCPSFSYTLLLVSVMDAICWGSRSDDLHGPADYLYVASWPGSEFCKIGRSRKPRSRLNALRCASPYPLELVHVFGARSVSEAGYDGPIKWLEAALHFHLRRAGLGAGGGSEWFRVPPEAVRGVIEAATEEPGSCLFRRWPS